jgi:hypothetical protein
VAWKKDASQMARSRNIKPGFYKNEDLAECSVWARFIFPGLWMLADREGRLEDRPKRIKGELLPFDSVEIEPLLQELERFKFIRRYEIEGHRYITIPKFLTHQTPHYSEKGSDIPSPLQETNTHDEREFLERSKNNASLRGGRNPLIPDSLIPDSLIPDSLIPDSLIPDSLIPDSGILNASAAQTCNAAKAAASDAPNPELLEWLVWWNSLKSDSLVPAGVDEDEPSQGVLKGWARAQKNPKVKKLLRNRDAIEREIRESSFCRGSWFRLEKLFGGVNRDGELVLQKLLEGGYRDKAKSSGGYDRSDPRGNMATVAKYLEGLDDGEE